MVEVSSNEICAIWGLVQISVKIVSAFCCQNKIDAIIKNNFIVMLANPNKDRHYECCLWSLAKVQVKAKLILKAFEM